MARSRQQGAAPIRADAILTVSNYSVRRLRSERSEGAATPARRRKRC